MSSVGERKRGLADAGHAIDERNRDLGQRLIEAGQLQVARNEISARHGGQLAKPFSEVLPRRDTTAVRRIPQAPRATGFGLVGGTWGSNFNGQLGGTDFIPGTGVVQVSGISKATAIAAGEEFSLAMF